MGLRQKFNNWKNAENPAPIDPIHIWRVIRAYWRKWFPLTPIHITEQAKWRLIKVRPICKNQGACTICGCEIEGLVFEDSPCEGGCYPSMKTKKQWNTFKKIENIKL